MKYAGTPRAINPKAMRVGFGFSIPELTTNATAAITKSTGVIG